MRAVNLLPSNYQKSHGESRLPRLPLPGRLGDPLWLGPIVGAALVVVFLAVGSVTQSGAVSERKQTLDAVQAELAARQQPAQAAPTQPGDAATRLAAATAASSARLAWEEVLHQFSLVLPEDVSITSLTATTTAGAGSFTLAGYTVSQPSVARLLVRLGQAPSLSNVQLQSSMRQELGGRQVIEFTIVADVVAKGATS
jgi:Tfp pilus assembly protein PilN